MENTFRSASFISGISVIYSFKFALEANTNQGIISSIYGLTPFIAAVLFYFNFGEWLKVSQILGMFFMVICIVLIGFGVNGNQGEDLNVIEDQYSSSGMLAISFAILCPILFAINVMYRS